MDTSPENPAFDYSLVDRETEIRLIALGDQVQAGRREAFKALHSFADTLAKLPSELQQQEIAKMSGMEAISMYILADEIGMQWLIDLLPIEAKLLVESWDREHEE